ncbi:MAG: MerR family transcriptional regulator [Croceibacterium sp.]
MSTYTVKQLARLSGVSVRALHHYDEIGLLKPAFIGENRYRYYGREELLRLQDILFHRELGVPLAGIARLLDAEGRDRLAILAEHRAMLAERVKRSRQLLQTIDRTIAELTGDGTMADKELYKGFSPEKQAQYEDWLVETYGGDMRQRIDDSKAHLKQLGTDSVRDVMAEGEAAQDALARLFAEGAPGDGPDASAALERHRIWLSQTWGRACPPEAYAGMADLYLGHPDFRKHFENRGAGFTDWLAAAMKEYAGRLAA